MAAKTNLVECMSIVEDPRIDRTKAHDLQDILVLSAHRSNGTTPPTVV